MTSIFLTPEITKMIEDIKGKNNTQNTFKQFLENLVDRYNNTELNEILSGLNEKLITISDEIKQSLDGSDFSLETVVAKIRAMIEKSLDSFNMTKFNNIYNEFLSKWKEAYAKIMTSLKERNISISGQGEQIKENMKNLTLLQYWQMI